MGGPCAVLSEQSYSRIQTEGLGLACSGIMESIERGGLHSKVSLKVTLLHTVQDKSPDQGLAHEARMSNALLREEIIYECPNST